MIWRRHLLPEPVLGHARAMLALAQGAARFFKSPSDANAFAAAESRKAARRAGREAVEAIKALKDPRREDWLALLRLLGDCSEEAGLAVEECSRFELRPDARLAKMAGGLRDACTDLAGAVSCLEDRPRCQGLVLTAKRRALEVERLHRSARSAAQEQPNVVSGLKAAAAARRLSQAAEAVQGAGDLLSELLAVEAA